MAPFDSALPTKISPLIDGQVPDFIQSDHPVFVEFLKQYYKFLESAEITISGTVDEVLLETATTNYLVLDGTNFAGLNAADRVVLETGSGTTGKFEVGETITGSTSGATATILVDAEGERAGKKARLFVTANQKFIEGETITGGTSSATTTLVKYRANPVQNIQQLLEYQSPDNTVDHFLNAFRDSFLDSIPLSLADGVSKRKLIKSIRDLYAAKGTSEGHKLFFRILLGQEAEIDYPAKYMMRLSDGNWSTPTIIRCTSDSTGAIPSEMAGQTITGASSGTTAQIIGVLSFNQGTDTVVQFALREDSIEGSGFSISETFTGRTLSTETTMQFTVQGIVTSVTINDGGILYDVGDTVNIDTNIGNGQASAKVSQISTGSISEVIIEETGENYKIGDSLKFTNDSTDSSTSSASGFVSVVGGRILAESSTSTTPEHILNEDNTVAQLTKQKLLLDGTSVATAAVEPYAVFGTHRKYSDSQTYYYPLYLTEARAKAANTTDGTAHVHVFDQFPGIIFYMPSDDNNHAKSTYDSDKYDLFVTKQKTVDSGSEILLETDFSLLQEEEILIQDSYRTSTDGIIMEIGTMTVAESTEINRLFLIKGGNGYTKLPTVTVTTATGSGGEVIAKTTTIGAIKEIEVVDNGFKYNADPPAASLNTNLILKDVGTSFGAGNTLQTHTGKVISYANETHRLTVDTTPTNRLTLEQTGTFNNALRQENIGFAGIGEQHHGPVNQKYSVLDEVDDGILIDNHVENDLQIRLENETGELLADDFEAREYEQISLEQDLDSPVDIGIELEDNLFVREDVDGRILLDGHRVQPFARSEIIEFHITLEDATVGTNVFGEQQTGELLFDRSMDDVGDNITLEENTPGFSSGTRRNNIELEVATESVTGMGRPARLIMDGSGFSDGDKVEVERHTNIEFGLNHNAILLEDSEDSRFNSGSYLIQEKTGNAIVLNTSGGVDNELDIGSKLLQSVIDRSAASNFGQSIKHGNTPNARLVGEGLDTFVTERTNLDNPPKRNEVDRVVYDAALFDGDETDGYGFIILDATEATGTDAGDRVLSEQAGFFILMDGNPTDPTFESGDKILAEDETLGDQVVLDGTDSASANVNSEIVMEDAFNVVGDSILDSAGGSGTIVSQGTAVITVNTGTTTKQTGNYINTDSLVSEDIIRIQDSYFYQQFSYEVKVGAILSDYINELKASVHPAGFIPFGKLALSTQISMKVGTTGESTIDYTGDDTFSPEFASLFDLVFDETLRMHHGEVRENVLSPDGGSSIFDSLLQENGTAIGDKLLEETDGDALLFESGFEIAVENSPQHSDGAILLDVGVGGSLLLETALGENPNQNRSVSHITKLSVRPEIKEVKTAYGAPLVSGIPSGSIFFDKPAIQLENGTRESLPVIQTDVLLLDGTDEFFSLNAGDRIIYEDGQDLNAGSGIKISDLANHTISDFVELDNIGYIESVGLDSEGDNIALDGTDSSATDAGDSLLLDGGIGGAGAGSKLLLDGVDFRNFSDESEGGIVFEQSDASDELVLEDYMHFILEGGRLTNVLLLENGHTLLQESNGQPFSLEDNLQASSDGTSEFTHIRLETETDSTGFLLGEGIQVGDNSINLVIETGLRKGDKLITEGSKIGLEDDTTKGSIPKGNFGNKNIAQFTREARIDNESPTNRIALQDDFNVNIFIGLEDGTGNIVFDGTSAPLDIEGNILLDGTDAGKSDEGSALLLDRTDGGGSDAGDNVLLDSSGGRDLGDRIQLMSTNAEFVPGNEGGFFLLSGTDGTSSNAGDEIILENGTLEHIDQQSINLGLGLAAESGGSQLPINERSDEAGGIITTFDSTTGTFDSTLTTFDAA